MKLAWKKRAKKRETSVSTIWRWDSVDGRYFIERHKYNQKVTYADAWFANTHDGYVIGNRFRKRTSAVAACDKHNRAAQAPKPRRGRKT